MWVLGPRASRCRSILYHLQSFPFLVLKIPLTFLLFASFLHARILSSSQASCPRAGRQPAVWLGSFSTFRQTDSLVCSPSNCGRVAGTHGDVLNRHAEECWDPHTVFSTVFSTCRTTHCTPTHTQHNTTQHNTTQHNTTQHTHTTQHNTTQHNTTHSNTAQHRTRHTEVKRQR